MDLQIFKNEEFGEIRTVEINGEPWFIAADICRYFGVTNRNRAMQAIDDEDKGGTRIDTPGGKQNITIINESGLYSLLFALQPTQARGVTEQYIQERLDRIKRFKHWITHEVIPSIRKNGGYIIGQEDMTDKELLARALLVAQNVIAERDKQIAEQEQQLIEQQPKVDFADHVSATEQVLTMAQMAKIAQSNNIKVGQNTLFAWLRENKILMSGDQWNIPYQQYLDSGYFKVVEKVYDNDGEQRIYVQTYVTGRGQVWLLNKLMKEYQRPKLVCLPMKEKTEAAL